MYHRKINEEEMLMPKSGNYRVSSFRKYVPVIFFSVMCIFGGVMQNVSLPLWADSFGENFGGPYFILIFSSLFYIVVFFTVVMILVLIMSFRFIKRRGPPPSVSFDRSSVLNFIGIGFFDALNGVLIVYASPSNRTPPILQAIFPNISVLYSIVATRLFIPQKHNNYFKWQPLTALILIFISIILSILPSLLKNLPFSSGNDPLAWSLIFMVGIAPGAIYNVLQEKVLRNIRDDHFQATLDSAWMLFWGCLFQFIFMLFFFWVDILPWYGFSPSFYDFVTNNANSWQCFFGGKGCGWSCLKYGLLFNIGYTISYAASAGLNIESANYSMLLSTLTSPVAVLYWVIFPAAGSSLPEWWSYVFPAIFYFIASVLWKLWEKN